MFLKMDSLPSQSVCPLNLCIKKRGSPSSFRRKCPFISLNSSAFVENLSSSEGARANHAKNDAQKGCVMQLKEIALAAYKCEGTLSSRLPAASLCMSGVPRFQEKPLSVVRYAAVGDLGISRMYIMIRYFSVLFNCRFFVARTAWIMLGSAQGPRALAFPDVCKGRAKRDREFKR